MKMNINPNWQKLEIQWITESWVPEIEVKPANGAGAAIQALFDPFSFVPGKPRRRKQPVSVLWVSTNGTRSSWR